MYKKELNLMHTQSRGIIFNEPKNTFYFFAVLQKYLNGSKFIQYLKFSFNLFIYLKAGLYSYSLMLLKKINNFFQYIILLYITKNIIYLIILHIYYLK
jgi:hypothetical protein